MWNSAFERLDIEAPQVAVISHQIIPVDELNTTVRKMFSHYDYFSKVEPAFCGGAFVPPKSDVLMLFSTPSAWFVTPIGYLYADSNWIWTPDMVNFMSLDQLKVSNGNWKGEEPANLNIDIISQLKEGKSAWYGRFFYYSSKTLFRALSFGYFYSAQQNKFYRLIVSPEKTPKLVVGVVINWAKTEKTNSKEHLVSLINNPKIRPWATLLLRSIIDDAGCQIYAPILVDINKLTHANEKGGGTNGTVYNVGNEIVVKVAKSEKEAYIFYVEIIIATLVKHTNILPVLSGGLLPSERMAFSMPLCDYTVEQAVTQNKFTSFAERIKCAIELGAALLYLHNLNCVHFDVKPSNCLIKEINGTKTLFLCDFGTAHARLSGKSFGSLRGTLLYLPPEYRLRGSDGYMLLSPTVDAYGFGLVLFTIMTNTHVPSSMLHYNYKTTFFREPVPPPEIFQALEASKISPLCQKLILSCLNYVKKRPTVPEICKSLEAIRAEVP
eukprot:Phypoly_transcript_07715.p1 GENE.Phypoly_transcript_07715~~Phypoly_transcript_07715.p1  ORF type:complete len:495 (+),score=84.68 Phypoly_transcript_07715:109-1593(+)